MKKKEGYKAIFEFNKEIIEHSPAGILRLDEKLRVVYENPKMREILGVPSGEQPKVFGTNIKLVPSVKRTELADKFNNLLKGRAISVETPYTSMYGKKSFLKVTGVPIFEKDKFAGAVLLVTDISEYKKVEEKLRESEERFSDVAANTGEWIWEVDTEGRYTYSSPVVEQVLGYTTEEVLGKFFYDFFHPDDREQLKSGAFEVFKRREPFVGFVNRNVHKNGYTVILETSGVPIIDAEGQLIGYRGTDCDVTEQKQMEEALQESEERFRAVFETAQDSIFIKDRSLKYIQVNPAMERLFGLPASKLIGLTDDDLFGREAGAHVRESDVRVLGGKIIKEEATKPVKGVLTTFDVIKVPMRDSSGEIVGLYGIARDITERKKAEEALRESEGKYRNLFENASDAIITLDRKGNVTSINKVAVEYGYERDEPIGKNMLSFIPKKYWPKLGKHNIDVLRGKTVQGEVEIITKKGNIFAEYRGNPIEKRGKIVGAQIILRDVTERKKGEEERKRFGKRLSALHTYAQSLNMAENLEEIYALTLKAMEKTLGFEYAAFLIIEGKILHLMAHCGYLKPLDIHLPLDGQKGLTIKAANTGKPILVPDTRKEKAYVEAGVEGMFSELAVPVKIGNRVLGVLNVESERLAAFDEKDRELLEILASHAAIAISDVKRHKQLRKISNKLANLMKSSTEIMRIKDMHQRLKAIAKAIRKFGWRRVVISLRDENLEGTAVVTAGLTKKEIKLLLERKAPGHIWRERLGPKFERFKTGEFYYLPWNDPWIREYIHGVSPEVPREEATTYAGVPSRLSPEEMVDWDPQDMLYAPLRTPEGRIVGILSMDDPVDGQKPTRESLTPLGLFLHQAAIVIENAQLIESLREARKQLEVYAEQLEQKVEERTLELKKSQEQLLKAQRLAVIGELAGMVGHDLRNPLTSIGGAAYYLKKRSSPKIDGKVEEMLELIEKNIIYSNKIINDLLDYSREIKLDLTESNPKSIIKESLALVGIPKNIQVIDLTENKPKIRVDVGKIKRAFINIIKNGIEAMPKGGTLTIKTKKLDGNLEFVFSDTGVGMSKKTMEKLWTPLFTTKAKGMGFGLPICKRTIEVHGGSISVKSARGKGTTFTVTIPTKPKIEGGEKIWVKPLESWLLTTTKA